MRKTVVQPQQAKKMERQFGAGAQTTAKGGASTSRNPTLGKSPLGKTKVVRPY